MSQLIIRITTFCSLLFLICSDFSTAQSVPEATNSRAIFAGGCFWCIEAAFQSLNGVKDAESGFCGGTYPNPSYEDVKSGKTDHFQAVQVTYDSSLVGYEQLLKVYWENIDPTDPLGQQNDRGNHYRTAIFYLTEQQFIKATQAKKLLQNSGIFQQDIVTMILPATKFYPAPDYHQEYFQKQSIKYTTCRQPSPSPIKHQKKEKPQEDIL